MSIGPEVAANVEAPARPWKWTRWSTADVFVIVGLAAGAFLFARWYVPAYRSAGGVPSFYQDQFTPAVMLACGRGFVNVDPTDAPPLARFLRQQADSFQCSELPQTPRRLAINGFQSTSVYLMAAAAATWRWTGVNWRALDVIACVFFTVTVAAAYAVLRSACGRTVSIAVLLLWVVSARHLQSVPHLRDYSKAPFFFLTLAAMAFAFGESRPWRVFVLGLLFGAVQAIGFGMRTDAILNFVPFFIVLAAGCRDRLMRRWRGALACAAISVLTFWVCAYPVTRAYARTGSLWHVVILGLTAPHDENLNIGFPRPAYSFPYAYNDNYVAAVVQGFWSRAHESAPPLVMFTPEYDDACRQYFMALATGFPADVLTRMLSSAIHVANLPFLVDGHVPTGVTNSFFVRLSEWRSTTLERFNGAGPVALALVLFIAGAYHLRYLLVGAILLGVWLTYPFLEFQGRHIFHLEFVVIAAVAIGVTLARRLIGHARRGTVLVGHGLRRSAAAVGVCGVAIVAMLGLARVIQIRHVRALIGEYSAAELVPLAAQRIPVTHGRVRLAVELFRPETARDRVQELLIAATFRPDQCGAPDLTSATFRYDVFEPRFGLSPSRAIDIESFGRGTETKAFLPVYSVSRDWRLMSRFVGVEIPEAMADCVALSQVRSIAHLPLLPVTVAPDWERKLYQRMRLVPTPVS